MAWPPVNHQDVQDAVTALRAAPPAHNHPVTDITATGVRSSSVYLRGDGVWATPSGGTVTTGRTDLYPEDYGYSTSGTAAANTTALQNFLNAITAGKTGVLRRGLLYQHNAVLTVPTGSNGGRLINDGELQATVPTSSAFKTQANGFHHEGSGKVTCVNVTSRGSSINHEKFVLDGCDGVTVDGLTIDGSHATGFFAYGASNYLVRDYTAMNTWADGIHNTNGSTGGRFRGTKSINCADDGMAVVSYAFNAAPCSDIDVQGHTTENGGSRGLAVVGGNNIRYSNCQVHGSGGAGAYIAAEAGTLPTRGCTNVRMSFLTINNANKAVTDHGSAMFFSGATGQSLTKCSFDFVIADRLVRDDAVAISGWLRYVESGTPGTSSELSFNNIHLRGTGPASNTQGNMATGVWEATNITRQATW